MMEPEDRLTYLRRTIEGGMSFTGKLTEQSRRFRQRASELSAQSYQTTDLAEQLDLLSQALSWIKAAENEEILAIDDSE
jgi:hypothetical protein